nr:unnamed protein product [Callosobruchus analis]
MTISLFRKQIGDKQSQISFYERHILELQNKKEEIMNTSGGAGGDNISGSIKDLQDRLNYKDDEIMKYQTLLKVDRDKHSLAAATLQEELQNLKISYLEEKQRNESLKESFAEQQPNRAALEQYISQVHALEKHTSELHTKISSLEAQLQSSREESVRWMSLANDRLKAMEELRNSLEDQHKNELMVYKTDSEKLKELSNDEKNNLLQLIQKQRIEYSGRLEIDIQKIIKEKDDKIHELTVKLRQIKSESKKNLQLEPYPSPKLSELEFSKDQLVKENDLLRKRYEQLINKEKSARDEIRELKAQLMRKPSAIRTDKSDRTIKEQLQKKIMTLENEVEQLKKNLAEQVSIIETHRVQAADNFDKWKKMKHWQQVAEKLKNKLKEKDLELEKLQQTSAGYRLLIERLEREKHNLEQRNRSLKGSNVTLGSARDADLLRLENMRLQAELEAVRGRMEMQQHHSGALGAAMMQEKLEAQERKIAILELASKGTSEIRAELERLQISNSNIQKTNLRLEAENLDLKLDLEKTSKEVPHLQQQIEHMQSYINVLQSENSEKHTHKPATTPTSDERKKVSELERTVFMLKRVVEKLQAENKRLMNGKRPLSDRVVCILLFQNIYNQPTTYT